MDLAKAVAGAVARGGDALAIEDVFSTYVYTGNGSTQDIVNGIDLATEGGMVWIKARTTTYNNSVIDSERGVYNNLYTNTTGAEETLTDTLTAFNSDGFTLGGRNSVGSASHNYVSWTFRKAPRFFDVVKYTGNGVAGREIAHDLGCDVGMMIIKCITTTQHWPVYHKELAATQYMYLSTTGAAYSGVRWDSTHPTDTVFTVGSDADVNASGSEYIAYLFADDPLGASGDGLIACGAVSITDGTFDVELGWEPQYILWKRADAVEDWKIYDSIRGWTADSNHEALYPNLSNAETSTSGIHIKSTGFYADGGFGFPRDYIYMAIRRPMRTPESSSEVFAIDETGNVSAPYFTSGFPVDFGIERLNVTGTNQTRAVSRLLGATYLETNTTDAEGASAVHTFDFMDGWLNGASTDAICYMWKRATGFFDVVTYTGNGVAGRTVDHNLGVVPEMIWVKSRSDVESWHVLIPSIVVVDTGRLELNNTDGAQSGTKHYFGNGTNYIAPTDTVFSVASGNAVNGSNDGLIAYLFATLAGISKVGSYTGNGSSQTIDCSFAAGAKFILIKRTDSTGDWFFWDTTRGIVAGNDPHLSLNTTAAQVTTDDSVDPDTTGFIVNQVAATNINVNSAEYIFYAVAI